MIIIIIIYDLKNTLYNYYILILKGDDKIVIGKFEMLVTADRIIQKKIPSKSKGKSNGLMCW